MLPLELVDWTLDIEVPEGLRGVLDGVSLVVPAGRTVALVGESGSGKSTVALGALGLLERPFVHRGGAVRLGGRDLVPLTEAQRAPLRPGRGAMVFQDPGAAFNPTRRIGAQLDEAARVAGVRGPLGPARTKLLAEVGLADPERVAAAYPHQLSGGMRQRAAVAMALCGSPALLVADEPTTALDVTVQAQLLALLRAQVRHRAMACLLISHDLGVVAGLADRVAVLYAGRVVEEADVDVLYASPRHPYTAALMAAARDLRAPPLGGAPPAAAALGPAGRRAPGCAFAERCPRADTRCRRVTPSLVSLDPGGANLDDDSDAQVGGASGGRHAVRCFYPLERGETWRGSVDATTRMGPSPSAVSAAPSGGVGVSWRPHGAPLPAACVVPSAQHALLAPSPALRLTQVAVRYGPRPGPAWLPWRGRLRPPVVSGVNLALTPGEVLALVGESGSGKSTLLRAILQLLPLASGRVWLGDEDLTALWRPQGLGGPRRPGRALRRLRCDIQAAFQDPQASLDPRQSALDAVVEPLRLHRPELNRAARRTRALALLGEVGLPATFAERRPRALSGGQRQRLALARALAPRPRVLLADEPTSALDVCVKGQVLELLRTLTLNHGLATLLVSHDLAAVRAVATRTAVMCGGGIVELGPTAVVMANPRHSYTAALLAAEPVADPRLQPARLEALAAAASAQSRLKPAQFSMAAVKQARRNGEQAGSALVEVAPGHFVAGEKATNLRPAVP